MRWWLTSLAVAVPALLLASDAAAVRTPDVASAAAPSAYQPPRAAAAAWQRLTGAHGAWQAIWDADTGVPRRIWGEGIAAPGANASPAIAEAAARALLAEQLDLLAPGTALAHWQLASNVVHGRGGAMRTVGFVQRAGGVPVRGGAVSFLFKRDRLIVIGSQARPAVRAAVPAHVVDDGAAAAAAIAWIGAIDGAPVLRAVGGLSIAAIAGDDRVVKSVTVDVAVPRGRWEVLVDAATGRPLARTQLLRFGTGTLRYTAPARAPAFGSQDYAAASADVVVDAVAVTTSATGGFSYTGVAAANVTARVVGPRVMVTSDSGPASTASITVPNGGVGVWNDPDPLVDAQRAAFVHAGLIKAFAKAELDPDLAWLDGQLEVGVNETGSCTAFSTGDDIHFFAAGMGCENTARVPDLVYHEFGHSLHFHAIIEGAGAFDSPMSEGASDYLAATTTDDSGVGRGYFVGSTEPLREIDPVDREAAWPADIADQPEITGLILAGALWDLRAGLIAAVGASSGKRLADDLYYAALQRASDIPSAYAEILAADDDDGNLANGTPHQCLIDAAFTPHGLVDPQLGLGVGIPTRDAFTISLSVTSTSLCPAPDVTSVTVEWRPRNGTLAQIVLDRTGDDFDGTIPTQPDDTVVEYRVVAALADGDTITYPNNPGDPFYQFYVGPLTPVYCTDFESDPFAAGWGHSAQAGADDWQWGAPGGDVDPPAAVSGTSVVGQDLTLDGRYQRSAAETLVSPRVDTTGKTGVRLQFQRWLSVEDGFYDRARIDADGSTVWSSFASPDQNATTHTIDREWRFYDVDLAAAAADGNVQISFRLESDQDLQLGGWTIDDFCIMARGTGPVVPVCGNGVVETAEGCDDGNTASGDGCSSACIDGIAPPEEDGCCSTGADPRGALVLGLGSALLLLRRRRRCGARDTM